MLDAIEIAQPNIYAAGLPHPPVKPRKRARCAGHGRIPILKNKLVAGGRVIVNELLMAVGGLFVKIAFQLPVAAFACWTT